MRKPRDYDSELKALEDRARQLKDRHIRQLGELVIATGADALTGEQLAGALLDAAQMTNGATRQAWIRAGAAFFQRGAATGRRGNRSDSKGAAANTPMPFNTDGDADRCNRSDCPAFRVGSRTAQVAKGSSYPPARISPVPRLFRNSLRGAGTGVVAFPPTKGAITPTSIIVRHRCTNDLGDLVQHNCCGTIQCDPIQPIEGVEEGVNHMVRHVRVASAASIEDEARAVSRATAERYRRMAIPGPPATARLGETAVA